MGLRAGYTVTPYGASQPSLNEQFTYRGGQLAQTVTISGTTSYTDTCVYSQHGMPLELLRTTNGILSPYWYERDGLGNVVALTDVNGNVVDPQRLDPSAGSRPARLGSRSADTLAIPPCHPAVAAFARSSLSRSHTVDRLRAVPPCRRFL